MHTSCDVNVIKPYKDNYRKIRIDRITRLIIFQKENSYWKD